MTGPARGHSLDQVGNDTDTGSLMSAMTNVPNRFEQILTVPAKLQNRLLRWQSEFDICKQAAGIGRALDLVTDIYHKFVLQFSALADSRMRLMHSPSEFMVTSMYFIDRALDGLIQAIASVRRNINTLFDALGEVKKVVAEKHDSAEKMYQEVEMMAKPDMLHFVEERKAKAVVFLELSSRIGSIRNGGSSMFIFLHKPWCTDSAFCVNILGPPEGDQTGPHRESMHEEPAIPGVRNESDPSAADSSANKTVQAFACEEQNQQSNKELSGQPKTPNSGRVANDAPKTQVSSPRQRDSSARKRARASRMTPFDASGVPLVRSLIPASPQASQDLEILEKDDGSNDNGALVSDKSAAGSQPASDGFLPGNEQPGAGDELDKIPPSNRLRSQRIRRRPPSLEEHVLTQHEPTQKVGRKD